MASFYILLVFSESVEREVERILNSHRPVVDADSIPESQLIEMMRNYSEEGMGTSHKKQRLPLCSEFNSEKLDEVSSKDLHTENIKLVTSSEGNREERNLLNKNDPVFDPFDHPPKVKRKHLINHRNIQETAFQ